MWTALLLFLENTCKKNTELVEEKYKLRFSAHLAILLMLQNRISNDSKTIACYNKLIEKYTLAVANNELMQIESKSKQIPLYISFIVGLQSQCEVYSKVMIGITDESVMKQYRQINYAFFAEEMCNLLLYCVPQLAIYDLRGNQGGVRLAKEIFLKKNWQFQRNNIEFTRTWSASTEEREQMDVLRWLQTQSLKSRAAFANMLAQYNELARKFLLEGKF